MSKKSYYRVKYCLFCLKPAFVFTGHLLKGRSEVAAGFCRYHAQTADRVHDFANRIGCFGAWHPKYGLQKDLI